MSAVHAGPGERGTVGWRRHLLALLVYLVGYYLYTFPAAHTFTTHMVTGGGDGVQNLWNNWWVRHAVAEGRSPFFTDYLYYPDGISLLTATLNPFNGFMTIPLCWFVDQVAAYNTMIVFAFVMTGYGMFLLAHDRTGSYWGSVLGGAVLTFSPYHLAHGFGHMQLISLQWVPFFLLLWLRLLRAPGHGKAVAAAAMLLLVVLCDYYYTMFCVLGGALILVHLALVHPEGLRRFAAERLATLTTFTVAAALFCGPILVALAREMAKEKLFGTHDAGYYKNDLFGLFIPSATWRFAEWTRFFWQATEQDSVEFANHLGPSVLALSTYAVVRSWRCRARADTVMWLVLGGTFYALSLGPVLSVLGVPVTPLTPYSLLEVIAPPVRKGGCPSRMAVMTALAAGVLTARGFAWAAVRVPRPRLLAVPLVALFFGETVQQQQPTYEPRIPPVVRQLRDLPFGCVVGYDDTVATTLLYQTIMEQPLANGYVARVPLRLVESRARLAELTAEGRYRELLDAAKATYLLRSRSTMPPVLDEGLERIAEDEEFELFVRKGSHPRRSAAQPRKLQLATDPATGPVVRIHTPEDRGRGFAVLFSRERSEAGVPFQGRRIPLASDAFFTTSSDPRSLQLRGNWGVLDEHGRAAVEIATALPPDIGRLWVCLVVFDGAEHSRLRYVTQPVQFDLSR